MTQRIVKCCDCRRGATWTITFKNPEKNPGSKSYCLIHALQEPSFKDKYKKEALYIWTEIKPFQTLNINHQGI